MHKLRQSAIELLSVTDLVSLLWVEIRVEIGRGVRWVLGNEMS